jgi:FkbM family methyltransferase
MTETYATPRDQFAAAIKMVKAGQFAAAIPLLEPLQFPFSPAVLAYARLLERGAKVAEFTHDGETFRFQMNLWNIGMDIFHAAGNFYEASELAHCRKQVPAGGVIVDVGANCGNHLVYFSRFLKPLLLIPVEPVDVAVTLIRLNAELNRVVLDERGLGVAASDAPGTVELALLPDLPMVKVDPSAEHTRSVPAVRLDDLVPEPVDFLKVDVEGFEMNVLKGAPRILTEDRPHIMIEVTAETEPTVLAFLRDLDYIQSAQCRHDEFVNHFFRPK